jgi:S1-C subfamily serine protease
MAIDIQQFSDQLADAVTRVGASTFSVDARGRVPATGVVWSTDGYILTADHVVQRDDDIVVIDPSGARHSAKLVGRDPHSDLALLKVEVGELPVPVWAETTRVGQLVLALGRPDDLQASLSSIVSQGGPIKGPYRHLDAYVQTDVTMFPGFSGGPLVDVQGRLIGINSSALARGASLAVPVSAAARIVAALKTHGRIQRGFIGVSTQPVKLNETVAAQLGQASGLMVIGTESGGPADQAGLLQGDVLVSFAGQAITDIDALQAGLGPDSVGQALPARIVRGGAVTELKITVGVRPA